MSGSADMNDELACPFLRVAHRELAALRREHCPGIALLAAGFGVERRLVGNDRRLDTGSRLTDLFAVDNDRFDLALGDLRFVAEELGRAEFVEQLQPDLTGSRLARADPILARLGALALHRRVEGVGRDLAAPAP